LPGKPLLHHLAKQSILTDGGVQAFILTPSKCKAFAGFGVILYERKKEEVNPQFISSFFGARNGT
jgi:hypothetical protein